MEFDSIFRFLIPLFILIAWIFQMLKRLSKGPQRPTSESESVEDEEDFDIDAKPYEPQTKPAPQNLELPKPQASTSGQRSAPMTNPAHMETRLRDHADHTVKRPRRVKQIAGIPLNAKSFYQGIILSEILMPPKSRRKIPNP